MNEDALTLLQTQVPRFIAALVILVVGWFIARLVAAAVGRAVARGRLAERSAKWLRRDEGGPPPPLERWASTATFVLLIVIVIGAFFQVLGLTIVTQPIAVFLGEIFEYAPRLIGPAVLIVVAWLLATGLRYLVRRASVTAKLDQRISKRAGLEAPEQPTMAHTLGDAVYWLTFLLFLPAILGALNLGGLLQPIQSMIDKLLGFLPNLLAAAAIVLVGWFIARIVQRLLTNLLAAIGADQLTERAGIGAVVGKTQLSSLLGLLAYILILIPVLIAGLNALRLDAITRPASEMLNAFLSAIPAIFAAALVLGLAFLVGRVVSGMISSLLAAAGFDGVLERLGIGETAEDGKRTPSQVVGYLVLVAIMLFATVEALSLLEFNTLAALVSEFLVFAGQVILGLIIFAIGLYLANFAAKTVLATHVAQAELLALVSRVAILLLAAAIGLRQMGLANEVVVVAFALLLGAVAVAAAVAFGIGGSKTAARLVEDWTRSLEDKRGPKPPAGGEGV